MRNLLLTLYDETSRAVDTLGTTEVPEDLERAIVEARALLAREFKAELTESGVQHGLLRVLGAESGDPDVDVPSWLAGNTPLGIERPNYAERGFPRERGRSP